MCYMYNIFFPDKQCKPWIILINRVEVNSKIYNFDVMKFLNLKLV